MPLCIDLYCGLGGWAEGFLSEGWDVIGFDIERHDYGTGGYPGQLVLQDVLTLHGSQFCDADVIVASPPCQAYSYRAMPWKRAKALQPPDNTLFEACFRIQQEASEAAGGDTFRWWSRTSRERRSGWGGQPGTLVLTLMPTTFTVKRPGCKLTNGFNNWPKDENGQFLVGPDQHYERPPTKNKGGSWFNQAHNTESGVGQNPVNGMKGLGGGWFGDYQKQKVTQERIMSRQAESLGSEEKEEPG